MWDDIEVDLMFGYCGVVSGSIQSFFLTLYMYYAHKPRKIFKQHKDMYWYVQLCRVNYAYFILKRTLSDIQINFQYTF